MAGRQALYHPDSSPAQNLVLSIRACALLDQAQRSPVLFAQRINRKMQAKEAWTRVSPAEEGLPGRKLLGHEMDLFLEAAFSKR